MAEPLEQLIEVRTQKRELLKPALILGLRGFRRSLRLCIILKPPERGKHV